MINRAWGESRDGAWYDDAADQEATLFAQQSMAQLDPKVGQIRPERDKAGMLSRSLYIQT